jgi:hypothetical protein
MRESMQRQRRTAADPHREQAPTPKYCPLLLNLRLFFDAIAFLPLLWQESDASEEE